MKTKFVLTILLILGILGIIGCPNPETPQLVVSPGHVEFRVGETKQLSAKIATVDTKTAEVAPVTFVWDSENPNVATVSKTGLVKGIAVGFTNVKVYASNGEDAMIPIQVLPTQIAIMSNDILISGETQTGFTYKIFDSEKALLDKVAAFMPKETKFTLKDLVVKKVSLPVESSEFKNFIPAEQVAKLVVGKSVPEGFFGTEISVVGEAGQTYNKEFAMTLALGQVEIPFIWTKGIKDNFVLPDYGSMALSDSDVVISNVTTTTFDITINNLKTNIQAALAGDSGEGSLKIVLKNAGTEIKTLNFDTISDSLQATVTGMVENALIPLFMDVSLNLQSGKKLPVVSNVNKLIQMAGAEIIIDATTNIQVVGSPTKITFTINNLLDIVSGAYTNPDYENGAGSVNVKISGVSDAGNKEWNFDNQEITNSMQFELNEVQAKKNYSLTIEMVLALISGHQPKISYTNFPIEVRTVRPNAAPETVTVGTMTFNLLKAFDFDGDDGFTLPAEANVKIANGQLQFDSTKGNKALNVTLPLNFAEEADYVQVRMKDSFAQLVWIESGVTDGNHNIIYQFSRASNQIGVADFNNWGYGITTAGYSVNNGTWANYGIYNNKDLATTLFFCDNQNFTSSKNHRKPFAKDNAVFTIKESSQGGDGIGDFAVEYIAFYKGAVDNLPKPSSGADEHWYQLITPRRSNLAVTDNGLSQDCTGHQNPTGVETTYWKIEKRSDGALNFISKAGRFLGSTAAQSGKIQAKASAESWGWELMTADDVLGRYTIGHRGFKHQVNINPVNERFVFDWGFDTPTSNGRGGDFNYKDEGCIFQFVEVL